MASFPFVDREPTDSECQALRLALSTFQDGTGWERGPDGTTLAGWRQIERVVAEVFNGAAPENKDVFDVVLRNDKQKRAVGVSVKSKQLTRPLAELACDGRLYLEISNSPAKFWNALNTFGIAEQDFRAGRRAGDVGNGVLRLVESWHQAYKQAFESANPGYTFDLKRSIHLVLSSHSEGTTRRFQWHAVDLAFPKIGKWEYRPEQKKGAGCKSIRGFDPSHTDEVLVDWYGLSGGQVKFYPRAAGLVSSDAFTLEPLPAAESILDRARAYWPGAWSE